MFDMTSCIKYLVLPLLPQRLQDFCSIKNSRFSLALEERLVVMVFIKPSWGATEGCGNENFYIDFQLGPTLEWKIYY